MNIGRFYLRAGNPMGAIGRFRTVVDKYQTTSHTPEALYRLVAAYLSLGLTKEAVRDGAVLGFNYPGDIWYRDAYRLLTAKGLRPAVTPGGQSPLPRLLPFGRHKETTMAPPAVDVASGTDVTQAATPATATPAKPAKPAKKAGFWHDVLGL